MPTPRRRRHATMRDVARVADVSLKTVSRVVNGEGGVRDDLVRRVQAAVDELHYRPDERARNLRQSDAPPTSIGFAMVDVANPFFSAILRGLEEFARDRGCLVLAGSSDGDADRQEQLVESFIARRVAGLVVVPTPGDRGMPAAEVLHGTPVVYLDCEPTGGHVDIVRSDHFGGTAALTRHLLAQGHRRIGFLGDAVEVFSARLRLDGFRHAMAEAGATVDDSWVCTESRSPAAWHAFVRDRLLAPDAPTALVSAQNFVTMGVVRALHELGRQHMVALVGFDDIEMADVLDPGITVYPQDPSELGRRACEILFRRIDGSDEPPAHAIIERAIVARGSGEIPPPAPAPVP